MKKLPVALQLYSVRDLFASDMLGVLREVAALGYEGVEFGGGYGDATPGAIKEELDRLGLRALSAHIMLEELERPETADAIRTLGLQYAAIPWLPEHQRPAAPGFGEVIARMRAVSAALRPLGVSLLYHNHGFEFEKVNGEYGLDLLREAFSPGELDLEIDTCWVRYSGVDPIEYLVKNAGRCPVVHLKDYTEQPKFAFAPVGEGVQDLAGLLRAANDIGASWLVVEQDDPGALTSMECARRSLANIRRAQGE